MTRLIAFLALALAVACGGGDPHSLTDDGAMALNSGNFSAAAKSYEKALAALGSDSSNPEWKRAKLGLIQAEIRLDADRAKKEFLDYAAASPSKVTDGDFNLIASKLGDAGKLNEAIEVLKAGTAAFPESPHLDALGKDLLKKAEESGSTNALDALKGLGYVGGD